MKSKVLFISSLLTAALSLCANDSFAEYFGICRVRRTYSNNGPFCQYDAKPGERLMLAVRYSGPNGAAPLHVVTNARGTIRRIISPFTVALGQERTMSGFISLDKVGPTETFADYMADGGRYADIELWSDRTNLQAYEPRVQDGAGDLLIPWGVNTNTPFQPVNNVQIKLFAGREETGQDSLLGTFNLNACVNRGNCTSTARILATVRTPIPRWQNWIRAIIDPLNGHAETNEEVWDNARGRYLGDFFQEHIPNFMRNINFTWELGAQFLDTWFDSGNLRKRSEAGAGIDWQLPIVVSSNVEWTLDPINSTNARFREKFGTLIHPSYFDTQDTRASIRERVRQKFLDNPSARTVDLSRRWDGGVNIQRYHNQHIQNIVAQSSGIGGGAELDAVTAALGGFAYYLVPLGTAERIANDRYHIQIDRLAIHVMDTFDFEGFQPLGCWASPNLVWHFPFEGARCFFNSDFRNYRHIKASGRDYSIFVRPLIHRISGSYSYDMPR